MSKLKILLLELFFCIYFFNLLSNSIKIGFWSTWKEQCGIAFHTEHIINSLIKFNYETVVYSNKIVESDLIDSIKRDKIDIFYVQYEYSIMPLESNFIRILNEIKNLGIKIIVTPHVDMDVMEKISNIVDQYIYLKPTNFKINKEKINYIPLGVPVFKIPNKSKECLRKKYGFKDENKILVTTGFMFDSKEFPEILELICLKLKLYPNVVLQHITSFSSVFYEFSRIEYIKILEVIEKHGLQKQIILITDYISNDELNERIWLSDLGYQWYRNDTKAVSAVCKQYISSRTPCVICDSSHYYGLEDGFIKVFRDKQKFVDKVFDVLERKDLLLKMKYDLEKKYLELNFDNLMLRYIDVFNKVLNRN